MSTRKPTHTAVAPLPKPKAIAYPPAAIWKSKEPGAHFEFRGNVFTRRGMHVTLVLDTDEKPRLAQDTPEDKS